MLASILFVALGAVSARSAWAEQNEPTTRLATQHARAWLAAQQSEDGSYGQRVPWRDTDLTLEALEQLDDADAALLASWLETTPANIDFLSRRIVMSASLGADTASDTALLVAAQQDDGGFPLSTSYSSDVLDTALALRALAVSGSQEAEEQRAIEYLLSARNSDGGWSYTDRGPSDIGLTAGIVRLLAQYAQSQGPVVGLDDSINGAGT
jgi:squalene cyclase